MKKVISATTRLVPLVVGWVATLIVEQKTTDRAYAMTSPQEYFAETTEAYFAKNDFQPYDREQLKAFDPVVFELLGSLWKCEK